MGSESDESADCGWTNRLHVNQYVDVLDTAKTWCEAVVIGLSQRKVHVHYRGWAVKYNEWLQFNSPRLAPAYTRVRNWRILSKGDRVQLGTTTDGQRRRLWRNGTILQTRRGRADNPTPAQVLVQLDGDREHRWVDTQDDLLCAPGTHRVVQVDASDKASGDEEEPTFLSVGSGSSSNTTSREDEDHRSTKSATKRSRTDDHLASPSTTRKQPDRASRAKRRSADGKEDLDNLATWRESLAPGVGLEVLDKESNHWYDARVFDKRDGLLCIRFRGWPWCYDEWIDRTSDRLAPLATHLGRWRDFKTDQEVQIGFKASPNADAPSHWERGIVERVARSKRTLSVQRVEVVWDGGDGPQSEWRDAQDDLLAPIGVPTYPPPKPDAPVDSESSGSDVDDDENENENELSADADANADNEEDDAMFVMQVAGQKDEGGELATDVFDEILCSITPDDLKRAIAAHPPDASGPPSKAMRRKARKAALLAAVEAAFATSSSSDGEKSDVRPPRRRCSRQETRRRAAKQPEHI